MDKNKKIVENYPFMTKILQKILRILTNVNILQETLKNIESFAIIEQLQDVDKYE